MNAGLLGVFLLLLLLIMLGGIALVIYALVTRGRRRRVDRAAPVLERLATVMTRRAEERPSRSEFPSRFFATFQLSDGSLVDYLLPGGRPAYTGLREGVPGVLVTQGSLFLAFRPGEVVRDAAPGDPR